MKKSVTIGLLILIFGGLSVGITMKKPLSVYTEENRPKFYRKTVFFEKKDSYHVSFNVEKAVTQRQLAYGLMYKKKMPSDEGMIFIFQTLHKPSFWMKNTYIPLDIIFIKDNGIISQISHGKPHDSTEIKSKVDVRFVLEVNVGQAKARGLQVGDRLMLDK